MQTTKLAISRAVRMPDNLGSLNGHFMQPPQFSPRNGEQGSRMKVHEESLLEAEAPRKA